MDSSDDFSDDNMDLSFLFEDDDREQILEGESGRPNQDAQISAGTLIAVSGEIEHLISQYQPTHDQATQSGEMKKKEIQKPRTFHVSKKRGGIPPDDEEKKKKKKISDQKYRAKAKTSRKNMEDEIQALKSEVERLKCANDSNAQKFKYVATQNGKLQNDKKRLKAYVKDIESQLQAANSRIERHEGAFELLIMGKNSDAQKLQDAATENGKLQYEINGLKDHVAKMEEELRVLKGINASPMEGNVTMGNDLQIGAINTSELQHKIYSGVQQLMNMFGLLITSQLLLNLLAIVPWISHHIRANSSFNFSNPKCTHLKLKNLNNILQIWLPCQDVNTLKKTEMGMSKVLFLFRKLQRIQATRLHFANSVLNTKTWHIRLGHPFI